MDIKDNKKMVYKKDNLGVVIEPYYNFDRKRCGIRVSIEPHVTFDPIFDTNNALYEKVVYEPGSLAQKFGATTTKRLRKTIQKCKEKIDYYLAKEAREQAEEKAQRERMAKLIEKIPAEDSCGLTKARYRKEIKED